MSIQELGSEKEKIYGEIQYESERKHIMKDYEEVEQAYNGFVEGKIGVKNLANTLGRKSSGIEGEHPSAQIYSYELLIKSLAEASDPEQQERIIDEILFAASTEELPVKKEYLLGILAYYSSRELYNERSLQSEPGRAADAKQTDESKIFEAFQNYLKIFSKKSGFLKEMKDMARLVAHDFPREEQDGQIARLVANYYAKEPHPTSPPEPRRSRIIDHLTGGTEGKPGSGEPMLVYTLPPGYHTSKQKIEEAKYFGIPLYTELARVEKIEAGRMKRGLIFNLDPAESHAYIEQIRMHLDQGEFVKLFVIGLWMSKERKKSRLWALCKSSTFLRGILEGAG